MIRSIKATAVSAAVALATAGASFAGGLAPVVTEPIVIVDEAPAGSFAGLGGSTALAVVGGVVALAALAAIINDDDDDDKDDGSTTTTN